MAHTSEGHAVYCEDAAAARPAAWAARARAPRADNRVTGESRWEAPYWPPAPPQPPQVWACTALLVRGFVGRLPAGDGRADRRAIGVSALRATHSHEMTRFRTKQTVRVMIQVAI